jgi:WD40 repeat protein
MEFQDLSGQTVRGYLLQQLIGAGGFGAVYKALQTAVKREVAVKVILPENASQPEFIRRFEAEAQLVARLEHLHIVPLYDYWRDPSGAYLVMRWLRGGSVRQLVQRGPMPFDEIARIMDQVAAALIVAHRNNVIHRDIKPDNVLLDDDANAYLADFGIAQSDDMPDDEEDGIVGSPAYLSPEQITQGKLAPQTDIYALGIMLYEMVTGRAPFAGLPPTTMLMKHLHEAIPAAKAVREDVSDALESVIQKATAKTPAARYANALDFARALRRALNMGELATPDAQAIGNYTAEELGLAGLVTERMTNADGEPLNPFKGLRAFEEADADDFFGREALLARLLARLQEDDPRANFLAVIGPSGSGKSSVVKAGVVPAVRRGDVAGAMDWFIAEMTPGREALFELAEALIRVAVGQVDEIPALLRSSTEALHQALNIVLPPNTDLLLVIDQFEEVFTQGDKEDERAHFLNLLHHALQHKDTRLKVIITMRADFYDRPLLYPEFGDLVRARTEVVLPMNSEELERAISVPAERAGLSLEVGLVTAIVADVGEQPGALPLLQYALTELYERRDGRWLTNRAYQDIGGVTGALARRADELYRTMDAAGQRATKQLFLRLVTPGEGSEDTRRRVHQTELTALAADRQALERVIAEFGKYRLLTFDREPMTRTPTVEVAHEALIRRWVTLRAWLNESRDALRLQRRLSAATGEWQAGKRDPSYLATGVRLDQFEAFLGESAESGLTLTADENQYVHTSLTARKQQQAAEQARISEKQAQERRNRRLLQTLVAVMTVAAVVAAVLGAFANNQATVANNNAATATHAQGQALQNETTARALSFASGAQLALSNHDSDLAALLALQAAQLDNSTPLIQNTLSQVVYFPATRRAFKGHLAQVISVDYSPDGARAVSASRDQSAIIWDMATGAAVHVLQGHSDWLWDAKFSPDGRFVLTTSVDKTLILWDAATGEQVRTFSGHTAAVTAVDFAPDGQTALSAALDETLILWDVNSGEQLRVFIGHTNVVRSVAFSKTGFTALSASDDGTAILWNVSNGTPLITLGTDPARNVIGHDGAVWSVRYSPDETMALTTGNDQTMILWSFETGQPLRVFRGGHSARVVNASFSPNARQILSCGEDNAIIHWDANTGQVLQRFGGQTLPIYDCQYSADGKQFLSANWDGDMRLWDLRNGADVQQLEQPDTDGVSLGVTSREGEVLSAVYSTNGQWMLTAGRDGEVLLWDADGAFIRRMSVDGAAVAHAGGAYAVVFNGDGTRALSGGVDNVAVLWDVATGAPLQVFGGPTSGHAAAITSVAFSPDETRIATGSVDNSAILWDVADGTQISRFIGHRTRLNAVLFTTDGTQLLTASNDATVRRWDITSGEVLMTYAAHIDWVTSMALSADGQTLMTGSADATLILWNVATGERLRTYEGHGTLVWSVALSPDGRFAVSGSSDTQMILWDVDSGEELRRYMAANGAAVRSVRYSIDGARVLAGYADGTAHVWQITLSPQEVIEWAGQNRYLREFTCTERERYTIEPQCAGPTPVPLPGLQGA